MRVATFNINNINKRLDNLLAWLAKAEPDVVSLQELKAEQEAFPVDALRTLGYEAVWQGERSWNGVAILARHHVPVVTRTSLLGDSEDHQARYIEAAVQGVLITSIYLPNGNPQPGPKFNYKLAWFERLIARAAELMASGAPVGVPRKQLVVRDIEKDDWILRAKQVHPTIHDAILETAAREGIAAKDAHQTFTEQQAVHLVAEHAGVAILTNPSVAEFRSDGVVVKPLSGPSLYFDTCLVMRSDDHAKLTNEFG